ncbi:hypothetical protein [Chryseobacterium soli]|uniref:hypothetical protein n=1 Tax=Chryseobacterium soli TaxID=445961 RepID=UPI00103C8340|nr:hypothetical protein [Chryseobacterium soli]
MRKIYSISLVLLTAVLSAQTGINTAEPKATLDVTGSPSDANRFDGIIAPRITGNQLKLKTYTADQNGALVYVTAAADNPLATDQTANVTSNGYYYFDALILKWVKQNFPDPKNMEPWRIQGTVNPAYENIEDIYQKGKVAIGIDETFVPTKQLEVVGDFKTEANIGGRAIGIETNFMGSGVSILYNADNITNPTDIGMIQIQQNSIHQVAQSPTNIGALQVTPGIVDIQAGGSGFTDQSSVMQIYENQVSLISQKSNQDNQSAVHVRELDGVQFEFGKTATPTEGSYIFPKTGGKANQILVTNGGTAGNGINAQLSWANIGSVAVNIRTFSGTVQDTDDTVIATGPINLPGATSLNKGKIYKMYMGINSNILISGSISFLGNVSSNWTLNDTVGNRGITLQSDGSNWIVIGRAN